MRLSKVNFLETKNNLESHTMLEKKCHYCCVLLKLFRIIYCCLAISKNNCGYFQFPFWISKNFAEICFSCMVILKGWEHN